VTCTTCHDSHSSRNQWQLRVAAKPVEVPFEVKANVGLSAICFECHNGRTRPADALSGAVPHYSSAAEMLSDTGGVEYGKALPNSPHGASVGARPIPNPGPRAAGAPAFLFSDAGDASGQAAGPCVVCHMWPAGPDGDAPMQDVGGHSFNMVAPRTGVESGASCRICHGDVKDFNLGAKADYDGNGQMQGTQDEVKGLLDKLLQALEGRGLKRLGSYPYATLPQDASGRVDPKIQNAWYNYRTVYGSMWSGAEPGNQGRASAIHNFRRSVALLQLAYRDLTGADIPGAEILVR
jgi:hypothetical protein